MRTYQAALAVVILSYNEEDNLPQCLASLEGLGELYVVDSGSTDRTLEIAKSHGARILEHPFDSHARQWRWAVEHLPAEVDWILGLDADQRLTPELRRELGVLFDPYSERLFHLDGIYLKRRQVFRGRWIRYGGYYPKHLLKLFRRDRVRIDDRDLLDHHFYVSGPTIKLTGDLIEANAKEAVISFWIAKHNRYAVLHAQEELDRRHSAASWPIQAAIFGNPDQRVLWLKQRWYTLPLYLRPILYFLYRYLFRFGFRDGKEGFIFHFLHGLWYRLLVDINIDEIANQAVRGRLRYRPHDHV